MKEVNPKLTPKKKQEANKFIKYIYQNTGIKFKCRQIKDYIFLKMLYLLLVEYEDIDKIFYKPVFTHYGNYDIMKKANFYGYSLYDILKQYIVKYYYGDLTTFAVVWEYYKYLTEDEFENRLSNAFRVLDKKIDKNIDKIDYLLDNITVRAIDYEIIEEYKDLDPDEYYILWKTQRDNVVCEECASRNGKKYRHIQDIEDIDRHPNCRCIIEIVEA